MQEKELLCSICCEPIDHQVDATGRVYWTKGHSAEPINKGRCCSMCNDTVVIPKRLSLILA
jgi:hypothetical protein